MLNRRSKRALLAGSVMAIVVAVSGRITKSADKNVNLDGATGNESVVSTNVVTTYPVKIKNKVTNKAVGQAFRFNWPSAGPGGFASEAGNASRPGTTNGVGATWTWETTQQVFAFTGSTACPNTNDICFTRTFGPGSTAPFGAFGVPGRSLTASRVTVTNESLTSSLLTFFSPETELFHVTSSVEQLASGLFRYKTQVTNLTGEDLNIHTEPSPLGCNSVCGNGQREGSEQCDGSDFGGGKFEGACFAYNCMGGTLSCTDECEIDDSSCHKPVCGDDEREGCETCDGSDLGGYSCFSVGASGGTLSCNSSCEFDYSECTAYCGNGVAEEGETCDGSDLRDYDCDSLPGGLNAALTPQGGGTLACNQFCELDITGCDNICGNGEAESTNKEECDGDDLRGATCEDLSKGTRHGELSCHSYCAYDTSGCSCGDDQRDPWEECDGSDLGDHSCESLGGTGGTLSCGEFCEFDISACQGVCGNGVRDGKEECEGTDFGGEDCVSQGGTGPSNKGGLQCDPYSCTIDTRFCLGMCGNGVIDDGEECDGSNIGYGSCFTKLVLGEPDDGPFPTCGESCQLDYSSCNVPCEVDTIDDGVGDGETKTIRCEISNHPAKEVSGQISVCGDEIPDGDPTCGASGAATQGTHNVLVPDEDVEIEDFYFTPLSVEVVGGDGLAVPGETVDLRIKLVNSGTQDATDVVGTLSCPPQDLDGDGSVGANEVITVVNGTASYPDSCMTGADAGSGDCESPAGPPPAGCAHTPLYRISIPAGFPVDVGPVCNLEVSFTGPSPGLAPTAGMDGPAHPGSVVRSTTRAQGQSGYSIQVIFVIGIGGPSCGDGIVNGAEQCDDGNVFAVDCCSATCTYEPSGSTCNDGQACTSADQCNGAGVCSGAPVVCASSNPCVTVSCNPTNGTCDDLSNAPDGTPCSTNPPLSSLVPGCPGGGVCQAGQCVPTGGGACPIGFVEADTTVRSYKPTTNFGTASEFDADNPPAAWGLVRFRLAGTSGHPLNRVLLKVFTPKTAPSAGRIHATTCNWSENTVTWNNGRPALGASFIPLGPVSNGNFYTYDITSLHQYDHDGTYCIGIDNPNGDADFASREAKVGRPLIQLETQCPCQSFTGAVVADATVAQNQANTNFGLSPKLTVDTSPVNQTFVRVNVSGVGTRHVASARLRLRVASSGGANSSHGGTIRLVNAAQCGWTESGPGGITWNTRPTNVGSSLSSLSTVALNQTVEFDLKTTIPGDGTYCYRIEGGSSDNADYNSLQGPAPRPELVLEVRP